MKKYNIDPLTGQLVEDKEGHLCLVAESEAENLESYDEMKNHKNEVIRKAIVIKKLKEENKHLQDINTPKSGCTPGFPVSSRQILPASSVRGWK